MKSYRKLSNPQSVPIQQSVFGILNVNTVNLGQIAVLVVKVEKGVGSYLDFPVFPVPAPNPFLTY